MKIEKIPKVQIIMSTYNGEKYISEQIESIFSQKECNISLLIRDDGSTDSTVQVIKELSQKYNIKLIQGENLKPAQSFLEALGNSDDNVDYYAFSDQDDVWKENKIITAINAIKEFDRPILYVSNLTAVDENKKILKDTILPSKISLDYKDLLIRSSHLFGCTMVFNKELRDFVKIYTPKKVIMHDLWLGLIAALKGKIVYDQNSYIYYRQHGNNHVGSQLTFKEKMKNRILLLKGKDRGNIANQAEELIEIIKLNSDISEELKKYTEIVATYNKSLKNKLKYLKYVSQKGMTKKQWLFHIILVLKGNV